jgi:hypothetical protein
LIEGNSTGSTGPIKEGDNLFGRYRLDEMMEDEGDGSPALGRQQKDFFGLGR